MSSLIRKAMTSYQSLSGIAKNVYLIFRNKEPCDFSIEDILDGDTSAYFLEFKEKGETKTYRFNGKLEAAIIQALINLNSKEQVKLYSVERH